MRLMHTSDWHLGRSLHGEALLGYQAAFLDWLLDQAVSQQVDAVLVAGDVYDRAVPPTDAVALLDRALLGFAAAGIPMVLTSGNHDSAVRLGFGAGLSERPASTCAPGPSLADPVVLSDAHGALAVYGIPYLLPDAVMAELGAERSHESVLTAAAARIRADAAARGIGRVVVAGARVRHRRRQPAESERDIRVGGIGDVPASVFDGLRYVALGHLHGQQEIGAGRAGRVVRYSGSPLAFSFGERNHPKSVTLVDIDAAGAGDRRPGWRRRCRGRCARCAGGSTTCSPGADGDLAGLAGAWVKVVLTDPVRPAAPMERLREKWPHTLVLDFEPEGGLTGAAPTWCGWRRHDRPGRDLRAVRGVRQRRPAGRGAARRTARVVEAAASRPRRRPDAAAQPATCARSARTRGAADRLRPAGRAAACSCSRARPARARARPGRDHVRAVRRPGRGRAGGGPAALPLRRARRRAVGARWTSRVRGVRYRITRVPEHQRPKRRGDGYTTEHAQVHLQRREGGGWVSLSSNKAEVGRADQRAHRAQPRRSSPRSCCCRRASSRSSCAAADDERRVLLSRLFGTQLYDRVTACSTAAGWPPRRCGAGRRAPRSTRRCRPRPRPAGWTAQARDRASSPCRPRSGPPSSRRSVPTWPRTARSPPTGWRSATARPRPWPPPVSRRSGSRPR